MELNRSLRDALLFLHPVLYDQPLLGAGNYVGALDELYLFLTNLTAIEYIRNLMKRDRKKDSLLVLASQNIEDFLQPGVRELTKPLFSIPTHQFLFNPGQLEPKAFCDTLQLEQAEFALIRYPERGTCLYRCGNERYLLQVHFPEFKGGHVRKGGWTVMEHQNRYEAIFRLALAYAKTVAEVSEGGDATGMRATLSYVGMVAAQYSQVAGKEFDVRYTISHGEHGRTCACTTPRRSAGHPPWVTNFRRRSLPPAV